MQRIALTTGDGYAISLRIDTIEMFQDSEGESLIRTTTGLQLAVKESAAEIDALIIAGTHRVDPGMAADFRTLAQAYTMAIGALSPATQTAIREQSEQRDAQLIIDRYWPARSPAPIAPPQSDQT